MAAESIDEYDSDVECFDFSRRVKVSADADGNAQVANEDDPFAMEDAAKGAEFMSVKPWEGAIVAPDPAPAANPAAPTSRLELEWVYGYRAQGVRNNICTDNAGGLIYPMAATVVRYDPQAHSQNFFRSHNDDITCLAQNPANKNVVATGQVASIVDRKSRDPFICVYDWNTKQEWKLPALHKRKISALNFSPDGKYLASAGTDNDFTIIVWDWQAGTAVARIGGLNKVEVLHLCWSSKQANEFCAVGHNTVGFYTLDGNTLVAKQGQLGKYARQPFMSVAYSEKGTCCVGAKDGSIYAFIDQVCKKQFEKVHEGPVNSLVSFGAGLISGSKDGVKILDAKVAPLHNFVCGNGSVRAFHVHGNALFVGTSLGEIYVIDEYESPASSAKLLVVGHHDGELWGLDTSASAARTEFFTVGEDNKLFAWDLVGHRLSRAGVVSTETGVKRRRDPRACTTSSEPTHRCARAVASSPNGQHIAIGSNLGHVSVFDADSLKQIANVDLNSYGKPNNKIPENWIQDLKYSPDGSVLAVGTHGSVICLLDVASGYKYKEKLKAHNSPITHLDWSSDGKSIQSNCLSYELLFHDITSVLVGSKQNPKATMLKNVKWATQTCTFGWPVQGIYRADQSGDDVNCCACSHNKDLIATGDDNGNVNLYNYPALKGHASVQFKGHSSHVMNARFTADDQYLITVGGGDKAVMQWRVVRV